MTNGYGLAMSLCILSTSAAGTRFSVVRERPCQVCRSVRICLRGSINDERQLNSYNVLRPIDYVVTEQKVEIGAVLLTFLARGFLNVQKLG